MAIALMNYYNLSFKRFLANNNWQGRRFRLVGSRFISYYATFKLQILQSGANGKALEEDKVSVLIQKMELLWINCDNDSCIPGNYSLLFGPKCKGEQSMERSLSLLIIQDVEFAIWRCYRTCYGWFEQLIKYFANRMMSKETLRRNSVMQMAGDKFTGKGYGETFLSMARKALKLIFTQDGPSHQQ